jgi:hypothetical protein
MQGTTDMSSFDLVAKVLADRIFPLYPFVLRRWNLTVWIDLWEVSF